MMESDDESTAMELGDVSTDNEDEQEDDKEKDTELNRNHGNCN